MNDGDTLYLQRSEKGTPSGTYGRVDSADRAYVPVTLEPIDPLAAGRYRYERVWSDEFKMEVFRGVTPGHTGIEFHRGNTIRDTRDCQLCGMERGLVDYNDGTPVTPGVLRSKIAFDAFMAALAGVHFFYLEVTDP